MSPPTSGGSLRPTRANATGLIPKGKEEQAKTTADTSVKDVATATEYLIDGDYKSEDDELTLDFLSIIAMQLSQQTKLSAKQASEGFRALSYLIFDLHQKRTVEVITDVIAKAISVATKRVRDELDVATEQLASAVVTSTNTVGELREECQSVVAELKDAVEEVTTSLGNVEAVHKRGAQSVGEGGTDAAVGSYANRVKGKVPAMHATVVAKAELQKRKIRLIKATGLGGDGLGDLTEKQWVEKANIALSLMEGHEEDKPDAVSFVGVTKEREDRGVIFEMNSWEAAGWLRDKRVMAAFLAKMGSTVDFKGQTYEVVVDWVPVSFAVEDPLAWKSVERSNDLRESAIQEVNWIKPTHLRTDGQRTAIAIFRLATREDANQVIEHGLYVEGKKVWGRKQVQEPKRCLKCQCFGEHRAAKCASIHDVCGRCGRQHRTSSCDENAKDKWECSNCKAMGNSTHKGHGAADRRCPIFLSRVSRMNNTRQENRYKYFCTTDPATWETFERNTAEQNDADLRGSEQRGGGQKWEEVRGGRRGGGKKGEVSGNTQKVAEKGGEEARGDTRAASGGSNVQDKVNGNNQTEASRNGNDSGARGRGSGKNDAGVRQAAGHRAYRQEEQRAPEPSQRTLNEMWKERERDFRDWSESMEDRMREMEMGRHQHSSPYV